MPDPQPLGTYIPRLLRERGIDVWRSDGSIEDAAISGATDYLGDLFGSFRGMLMFPGGGNIGLYEPKHPLAFEKKN